MRQNIQLQPEFHSAFLDSALSEYFRHAGERFAEESAVFLLQYAVSLPLKDI
jgi:hypothetical protein